MTEHEDRRMTAPRQRRPALDLRAVDDTIRERFWAKVDVGGPDECWLWTANRKPNGYGQFALRRGEYYTASRFSLALSLDRPLEPHEQACHRCDNPPCVNPSHLFAGTVSDNALDSVAKGRARRALGTRNAQARLSPEQVRDLRSRDLSAYGARTAAARELGVSLTSVKAILSGRTWGHL